MRVIVVLPALNEESTVAIVVKEVQAAVPDATVLVVDDGSVDRTGEVAREAGAQVVTNPFNLGVGGAMRVGFRVAEANGDDILLQVDADGQHNARDIGLLLAAFDRRARAPGGDRCPLRRPGGHRRPPRPAGRRCGFWPATSRGWPGPASPM